MKVLHRAWACALLTLGCGVPDAIGKLYGDVAVALGKVALEELAEHPAAVRASMGTECDSELSCEDDEGTAATSCVLDDSGFVPAFRASFADCMLRCGEGTDCFDRAVEASVPSATDESAVCTAALARCELESDACAALDVLESGRVKAAIAGCNEVSCDIMRACYMAAVLQGIEARGDAGR